MRTALNVVLTRATEGCARQFTRWRRETYPGDDIPLMAGKLGVLGANGPYNAGGYAANPGGVYDDPMGEERAEARPFAGVGI